MTYISKPKLHHPKLPTNKLGFTRRDYEGAVSTLCAGCGHDSISAAIVWALGPFLLIGIAVVVAIALASSYALCRALDLPRHMAILIACGRLHSECSS